ncbi:tyrosine--tRNA ligase, partial [Candidatus Shapirobacteria bacterium CG_4_9_14_3_um_filter_39_13]
KEGLEKVLRSGKKLRIYNGIDPTGKLHLGHMVVLRKLRQLQDLDQEIIV